MTRLATRIIHLLGGLTPDEVQESYINASEIGKYLAYSDMKDYADRLHGMAADSWARHVYERIRQKHSELLTKTQDMREGF